MDPKNPKKLRRRLALASAFVALIAIWIVVSRLFTLAEVRRLADASSHFAEAYPVAVFAAAALLQALGMTFSLPTKAPLVLLVGALLGTVAGAAATEIGVVSGTTLLFFGCRRLIGDASIARFGKLAARFEKRLRKRPVLAIVGLRLVVTIPYGPITIACAALGVRYRDFLVGSILGDLPVTALYALAGHRIATLLTTGEAISPATAIVLSLAGLALTAAALFGPDKLGRCEKEEE
jgi:uncharacterized membrane protein YdjX (TVP38/TMEM64 family)